MIPVSSSVREVFQKHKIRCTRQRELIFATLTSATSHPTAEELLRLVRLHDSAVSLATVYNTLDVFLARGLCRKLASTVASGPCRFDATVHDHAHGVLPTGEIVDLPESLSAQIVDSITPQARRDVERRVGARVVRIAIEFILAPPKAAGDNADDHAI